MAEEQTYTIKQFIEKYGTLGLKWNSNNTVSTVTVNNNNITVRNRVGDKVLSMDISYIDRQWYLHGKFIKFNNPFDIFNDNKIVSYYYKGVRQRSHKPATKVYDKNNQKIRECYIYNNQPHRDDGPANIAYKKGIVVRSVWVTLGKVHRLNGPAVTTCYDNGTVKREEWYYYEVLHREDGPAIINYDELGNVTSTEYYYLNVRQGRLTTKRAL